MLMLLIAPEISKTLEHRRMQSKTGAALLMTAGTEPEDALTHAGHHPAMPAAAAHDAGHHPVMPATAGPDAGHSHAMAHAAATPDHDAGHHPVMPATAGPDAGHSHAMAHAAATPDHGAHAAPGTAMPFHVMPDGSLMLNDAPCGYCQLLMHVPVIACMAMVLLCLLRLASRPPPVGDVPTPPLTCFPGQSQPRAPPARSLLLT
ncbi:hypothetical protein [Pantoea sp. 1.19]|uniref:hypothetical protein n=1 Tax=Pantoea sp. 1.19 TaxID=1925589 RepID=UPI0011154518|nr:hypothetical protein [Pantoea sp. 1.19]